MEGNGLSKARKILRLEAIHVLSEVVGVRLEKHDTRYHKVAGV